MRIVRLAAFCSFLLLLSAGIHAQVYSIRVEVTERIMKDRWNEVKSRNFLVVGNVGTKQLRNIAVDLEEIRRQFYSLFPRETDYRLRTTVIVFRNEKSFQLFHQSGAGNKARAGYIQSGVDRHYIVLNAGEKRRRQLYHDYVHLLIGPYRLPFWLQEGLAEYYASVQNERYLLGDGRTLLIGFPIYEYERVLKDSAFLPLESLLSSTEGSSHPSENEQHRVFVAESWALVHFLHANARDLLEKWIQSIVNGTPAQESFDAIFDVRPAQLEAALREYVRTSKSIGWPYKRIPYCMCESSPNDWLQFNFDRSQTLVKESGERKLSDAEIRFHLGDLLLHRGQTREAEAYLEEALRLDPELVRAHASLGVLQIQEGRYEQAKPFIDRALALDSDNPLPYFFYAWLIRHEAQQSASTLTAEDLRNMQMALQRAVRHGPYLEDPAKMLEEVNQLLGDGSS